MELTVWLLRSLFITIFLVLHLVTLIKIILKQTSFGKLIEEYIILIELSKFSLRKFLLFQVIFYNSKNYWPRHSRSGNVGIKKNH